MKTANSHVSTVVLYENPREEDILGKHYDIAGRVSAETLSDRLAEDAECYFCGPRGFMAAVDATLAALGVPESRRHYEVFGPTLKLKAEKTDIALAS